MRVYDLVALRLDAGFVGTYGELAVLVGSHPRAVGTCVKRYAHRHPGWDHRCVYCKRTGLPGYATA